MDAGEGDDSGLSWYDFGALMSGASQGRMQFLHSVSKLPSPCCLRYDIDSECMSTDVREILVKQCHDKAARRSSLILGLLGVSAGSAESGLD